MEGICAGLGEANLDSNFVTGTFLLNNSYASMLFDSGADRSFVSTTFNALLDVVPSTLDISYAVEIVQGSLEDIQRQTLSNLLSLVSAEIPRVLDAEAETFMDLKTQLETVTKNHQASIQNLETKFDRLADKQSGRPSGSLPSNTQPNPKGHNSKAYQPPQSRNKHVNAVFTKSGKFYNPPVNPNNQQDNSESPINFDSDDEDKPTPQPKIQTQKSVKETPLPKPYKPKILYPQRLRKEKIEAQYGKFLDMIRAVRINVPLVDVLARMPNYGKFLKELISNKHKIEQISTAFLSDESSAMIQNKVPPKLGDPRSFLIPCNFNKTFSCNALADLGASINLMSYSLYAKLSLETLKPTKMSVRLAERSFQYLVRIAKNMLVEVGKFTFPADFVILEMEEDSKVPLILRRPFLHTADAVIRVKQKQLNLGEDFDALLDEGSKILHSIEGTLLEEEIFAEFDEFMAITAVKIVTLNLIQKKHHSRKSPSTQIIKSRHLLKNLLQILNLTPLPDNLEYVFLEEPSFLPVIISSQLSKRKKNKLIQLLDDKKPVVQKQRRLNPNMQEVVKKEIVKLLDTGSIYPIVDSPWVSLIHCVPKKGGITVVINENDELVLTRTITGWQVCIDYRKLNEATAKDHFPLPFMDQMLERLARNKYFCFLDGFSGYFPIPVDPNDQEKTTFTCPFRHKPITNAFRAIEGIVLGHKVSSAGLKVDKAKIDILLKLPPPANIKALKHLFKKQDAKPRLIRWILLLQEFNIEIKDRKGTENVAADHLSRIENDESSDDNFANYLVADIIPKGMTYQQKNKFFSDLKHYFWEETYLFKVCFDGMIRRCLSGPETQTILDQCHHGPIGGHYGPNVTAKKVLDLGFYWPTIIKEAHTLVRLWEACQKTGNISKRDKMPLNNIQAEAQALPCLSSYHLPEETILPFRNAQSSNQRQRWAFCTAYKTPTGTTPYKLINGKNCHLPFEIEHRAYWALKNCNLDLIAAGEKRMFQLHELDELRHQAYENSRLYKARTKVWHDKKLRMRKEFKQGNKVLLFHSKYKFKQPKLRSRWLGPYVVKHQYPSGYVELYGKDGKTFIVNGHRLKLYHEEDNDPREAVTPFFPKE
ncbi:reverse transcriptase domain-containing protein [Tanacetum coccineum]